MKISANGRLARFAYLLSDYGCPYGSHVSLCVLFWRCVGTAVALLIPMTFAGIYIAGLIVNTKEVLIATGILLGILALVTLIASINNYFKYRSFDLEHGYVEPTPLETVIYGIKNKVCPLIEIVHED